MFATSEFLWLVVWHIKKENLQTACSWLQNPRWLPEVAASLDSPIRSLTEWSQSHRARSWSQCCDHDLCWEHWRNTEYLGLSSHRILCPGQCDPEGKAAAKLSHWAAWLSLFCTDSRDPECCAHMSAYIVLLQDCSLAADVFYPLLYFKCESALI